MRLADRLGVKYAWFAEHHAHAHYGHLPTPLLYALHLAGQTKQIQLGTAIICLNLHDPLDVAEQVAVADVLSGAPHDGRVRQRKHAGRGKAIRHARYERN